MRIAFFATFIGMDEVGNRFFESRSKKNPRRYVLYAQEPDPSTLDPLWTSWLHHAKDELPNDRSFVYPWVRQRIPNQTGTLASFCLHGLDDLKANNNTYAPEIWSP